MIYPDCAKDKKNKLSHGTKTNCFWQHLHDWYLSNMTKSYNPNNVKVILQSIFMLVRKFGCPS